MSLREVVDGLNTRFLTIAEIKVRLDYEPSAVQNSPLIYTIMDSFVREHAGTVTQMRYRLRSRLCIRWQSPEHAEATLVTLANSIPQAIDADRRLGGVVRNASVQTGDAGWVTIGGVEYRVLDFFIDVLEVGPAASV